MERSKQFVGMVFTEDSIHGAAAEQREACRQTVQRKASENLQCSKMSKLANETLDIFVQQATANEAWKSNLDMHLVKGTDWKRKKQSYSFKLWYWKRNNKQIRVKKKIKCIWKLWKKNWSMICCFFISQNLMTEEAFASSILTSWIIQVFIFLSSFNT